MRHSLKLPTKQQCKAALSQSVINPRKHRTPQLNSHIILLFSCFGLHEKRRLATKMALAYEKVWLQLALQTYGRSPAASCTLGVNSLAILGFLGRRPCGGYWYAAQYVEGYSDILVPDRS